MTHLERVLISLVCIVLAALFLYLSGYAMVFTSVIEDKGYISEPIKEDRDDLLNGLLALLCGVLLLWVFGRAERHIPLKAAVSFTLIWTLAASIFWVCAAQNQPRADAGYIATAAQRVIGNNFSELKRAGGYFNQHPYQVGFLMLSELLQRLFGKGNYLAMQIFNAVCLTGAYGGVLSLTWRMSGDARLTRFTALFLTLCLQPLLYCTFLYGNIISVMCVLWAACLMVTVVKDGRLWLFAPAGLLCGMGVLFKPNGWLPVIAMLIVGGLWLLCEKRWKLMPLLLALVLGPLLVTGGVKAVYAARANANLGKGVPMTAYLAMGLQESSRAPGWYNEYVDRVYQSSGYDPAKASARAVRNIQMRLNDFAADPAYAADFFHQKMVSQWNETTFEAIWVNKVCRYDKKARLPFAQTVLNGELRQPFEGYMEGYTIVLYWCFAAGVALFAADLLNKRREIARPYGFAMGFMALSVFGAFLYHMLFEAKSQYLFTYLLLMIPIAAAAAAAAAARPRRRAVTDTGSVRS